MKETTTRENEMQVGDKVQDEQGRFGEVTLIAVDSAGSFMDPGETVVFVIDWSNGIERLYLPEELHPADTDSWNFAAYKRQRASS